MVHMPITTLNRAYTKTIKLLINLNTIQKLYYIGKSTNFYFRNFEKMLVRGTVAFHYKKHCIHAGVYIILCNSYTTILNVLTKYCLIMRAIS